MYVAVVVAVVVVGWPAMGAALPAPAICWGGTAMGGLSTGIMRGLPGTAAPTPSSSSRRLSELPPKRPPRKPRFLAPCGALLLPVAAHGGRDVGGGIVRCWEGGVRDEATLPGDKALPLALCAQFISARLPGGPRGQGPKRCS